MNYELFQLAGTRAIVEQTRLWSLRPDRDEFCRTDVNYTIPQMWQ